MEKTQIIIAVIQLVISLGGLIILAAVMIKSNQQGFAYLALKIKSHAELDSLNNVHMANELQVLHLKCADITGQLKEEVYPKLNNLMADSKKNCGAIAAQQKRCDDLRSIKSC